MNQESTMIADLIREIALLRDEVAELKAMLKTLAGGSVSVPTAHEEIQALKGRGVDIGEHLDQLAKAARRNPTRRKKEC